MEWVKEIIEEIFKPDNTDWDNLYNWVKKYGDEWDLFLMELTVPELFP